MHSKISNLTKYREVLVKYSVLITHAEMPTPVTGTTNGFIFQIINSLIESWGVRLTWFDCKTLKSWANVFKFQMLAMPAKITTKLWIIVRFCENCPPTPPLSQHFALSEC